MHAPCLRYEMLFISNDATFKPKAHLPCIDLGNDNVRVIYPV